MPGMGLLRKRAVDVDAPDPEALAMKQAMQGAAEEAVGRVGEDRGQVEVIEEALKEVKASLGKSDGSELPWCFKILEALEMWMDEDSSWANGKSAELQRALMSLIYSGWVSVVRALKAGGMLNAAAVPNYRYVLTRALSTSDAFTDAVGAGEGGVMARAGDVLEEMVNGGSADDVDPAEFDMAAAAAAYTQEAG
eukprot:CAMPEP_0202861226 /NCGR_PEP_ID=MMETSP1391-20130828/2695_1 /ASSEMBLY_ACC=CAM_ASM_000867 /TAXON_ID=1034604 /ORGANISM="Chlamydomonas leiostraca, Strain SAG 11-49" /LENGTH=193 /DNA_ID=CAMNT_0049540577 /DNA_START=110 /DNA_END=687 /DNA_ORIENTATION=-